MDKLLWGPTRKLLPFWLSFALRLPIHLVLGGKSVMKLLDKLNSMYVSCEIPRPVCKDSVYPYFLSAPAPHPPQLF